MPFKTAKMRIKLDTKKEPAKEEQPEGRSMKNNFEDIVFNVKLK